MENVGLPMRPWSKGWVTDLDVGKDILLDRAEGNTTDGI